MAFSNKFWQIISKVFPFTDFIHFLQLEDYNSFRYLSRLNNFFFRRNLQRLEKIVWTTRVKLTFIVSILLTIFGSILFGYYYLTFSVLIFYYIYNKNGPKILWWFLTISVFIINSIFVFLNFYPSVFNSTVQLAINYLSWLIVVNAVVLAVIIGLSGKSCIPNKSKLIWVSLGVLVVAIVLFPVDVYWLLILKLVLIFLLVSILFIPVWVGIANFLVFPVFYFGRMYTHRQASIRLRKMQDLKVISVIGSFGKTTTKNFIYQLLRYNYRVQMVPGNINTATGIAGWVLKNLEESTEILLVEVDGYDRAEFRASGQILKPEFVVLTNIGDQHLERFGTRKNLAQALLGFCKQTQIQAKIVLLEMTMEDIECYGYEKMLENKNKQVINLLEKTPWQLAVALEDVKEKLSSSNETNLLFALKIAELLDIPSGFILDSIKNLELPDRRQFETELYGFMTLDDSYNISFTTAKAGLNQASKRAKELKKKLVIIFGGIPELGSENNYANKEIVDLIVKKANFVILLNTSLISDTQIALQKAEFDKVYMANRMTEAWDYIQVKFNPKTHYILMQPELNDLYYEL